MKKRINQKGFALVETLICAVFVCAVFMLLIINYYPMLGKLQRYQNYDETENKYIAYHLSDLIKTNSTIFNDEPTSVDGGLYKITIFDKNTLCYSDKYNEDKQQQCSSFFELANISRVYYTTYSTKDLKNHISDDPNSDEPLFSRAFELYVKYMPSHEATNTTKGNDYRRIIIEREIIDEKSGKTSGNSKKIYKYANIEVKVK